MKILDEVREIESRYHSTPVNIFDGLTFSQEEAIRVAEYYTNSKYLGGNKDELGRDKPFYNIVNFRVQLAKVATDFDIKDFDVKADNPKDWVRAMLLRKELYEWMKTSGFSQTLNKFAHVRPKYGGVVVKKVEDGSKLKIEVVDWRNLITDQVYFGAPKIEKHYLSPVELNKKRGVWNNIEDVLEHAETNSDNEWSETGEKIEIWEVTGEFSKATLKEYDNLDPTESDEYTYSLQKYIIYPDGKDEFSVLYAEELSEDPYRYLAWDEVPGRLLGRGVIEESEEAQVWTNDAVINEKNAMDLAGRVVLKTNQKKLPNSVLEVDHGKIFTLDDGKDMNVMNLAPGALGFFKEQVEKWREQVDRATSAFDANTGEQPPSGTPYSQTALLSQVASRPFDFRKEEAAIFWREIFTDWVIPYVIKKIKKEHILSSDFTDEELDAIDTDFSVNEVNKNLLEQVLKGAMPSQEQYDGAITGTQDGLKKRGSRRFIKVPKGYFDGIGVKLTIDPTNEQKDKGVILQSLSTVLQTVSQTFNPQTGQFAILENPTLSRIFGRIVEEAGIGISPVSLVTTKQKAPTAPVQPIQAPFPQEQVAPQ